jgi:hypothetical protein
MTGRVDSIFPVTVKTLEPPARCRSAALLTVLAKAGPAPSFDRAGVTVVDPNCGGVQLNARGLWASGVSAMIVGAGIGDRHDR